MGEFELIRRHFQRPAQPAKDAVVLGIGDDCALLQARAGWQLAVSTDMLVQGRHFFSDVSPEALGHKSLAVNLSDLAAMGAHPLGFTLALALPEADDAWLGAFARGLFAMADTHDCPLIGGDTTRGPLNICITVLGEIQPGQGLRRGAARPGDDLYLSGQTGEARLALELLHGTPWATQYTSAGALERVRGRLERPTPRLALGRLLAPVAHAALDLSDGLCGDLGHLLQASQVGAEINLPELPMAQDLAALPEQHRLDCLLNGGDDYELIFTAAPEQRTAIAHAATASQTPVHRIGRIVQTPGLSLLDASGRAMTLTTRSFDHFA